MPKIVKLIYLLLNLEAIAFTIHFLTRDYLSEWFMLTIPVFLLIAHAFTTLQFTRFVIFATIALIVGFTAEYLGLTTGFIFGDFYRYDPSLASFLGVPYIVPIYWAVFTYLGLNLTNTIFWKSKQPPALIIKTMLDATWITSIDLFMDPIQVKNGTWTWANTGTYFGVPIGNFIGWFIVSALITGTYRLFDKYLPKVPTHAVSLLLIPPMGYTLLIIAFIASAIDHQLTSLMFVATPIMAIPILLNSLAIKGLNPNKKVYNVRY